MDFELGNAQQEIKDPAAGFATESAPYAGEWDREARAWGGRLAVHTSAGALSILTWKRGAEGALRTEPGTGEKIGCLS